MAALLWYRMSNVVNLRQTRKKRARAEKQERAAENRVAFGRSKAERKAGEAQRLKEKRELDKKSLKS